MPWVKQVLLRASSVALCLRVNSATSVNSVTSDQNSKVAPTFAMRAPSTDVGVSQVVVVGLYVWL